MGAGHRPRRVPGPQLYPLQTAVKGARAFAQLLQEELGFDPAHVILLENEQATQRAIRRAFNDPLGRRDKVGPDDRVLVYFGGHGLTFDTPEGLIGCIAPFDVEPAYWYTAIAIDELTRVANRSHAKHVLFLLDACFSGYATVREVDPGVQRQVGDFLTRPARQVITAGMRDQTVLDLWGPGQHSLFTGFLLQGLGGVAPAPGGVLRAFHLAGYLQDQVAQHSHSRQTPQYAALMGSQGGDFVFSVRDVIELPPWLMAAAASEDPTQRLVAVSQLRTLAQGDDPDIADQALARLTEMAEVDRDGLVLSSAQAVLRELMPETEVAPVIREEPVVIEPPVYEEPESPVQSVQEPTRAKPITLSPQLLTVGGVALAGIVVIGIVVALLAGLGGGGRVATEPTDEPIPQTVVEPTTAPTREPTETEEPTQEPPASPAPTELPTEPATQEPTLTVSELAEAGVSRNADWTPYIEEQNSVEMALVPVGCFMMGGNGEGGMQCFDKPFWIDVTEVTNAQYGSTELLPNRPRGGITWFETVAHCERRGTRLPTEAEWEYAARGPDGLRYPWGNEDVEDNWVDYRDPPDVGSRPAGASWVGALDMIGSLSEWVSSIPLDYPYDATDGREPDGTSDISIERVYRGGHESTTMRFNYFAESGSPFRGWRCARDF